MERTRVRTMVFSVCALAALSSCTPHPVAPARTFGKYQGKAVTSAESARSIVETVRLVAETASRDNSFGPYTSVTLAEQEDSLSGVEGTFDSIQPPDDHAESLRSELGDL